MTTFTERSSPCSRRAGFSMPELIVATAIAAILLTVSATALATLGKGSQSLINYSEMNSQSRHALDTLGGYLRSTSEVFTANADYLSIERIKDDGTTESVIFSHDSADKTLEVTVDGVTRTMLSDINFMQFNYFTFRQDATTNPLEVKHVQLEAELTREVLTLTNRNYIISARFMLRNHRVSN